MTVMLATLIELEAIQEELPVFPSAKEVCFFIQMSPDWLQGCWGLNRAVNFKILLRVTY